MAQAIDYVKVAEALLQVVMGVGLPLLRVAYDPVGDTLYVHFTEEPVKADDSEFIENDVSVRYRGEDVVGITILNASKRSYRGGGES
ncbi:MAG: DUF2283 domain-containing protein [Candidatus Omnitrophota bacterium]|nr:DUF2283 domain-containing protein [Candidatus Omnitrophota bacterium]